MDSPKTIGRYEILDELGHGAMGAVFRARDPAMDRTVALKTILSVALASEQSDEYRQRFYREARAAGALTHPGIVPVFDMGEFEGMPFLVMEFVNGQTLADAMKKGERMSMDRVCEIGQQIAEALGYAHRKGVIHRDIKPANVLLTSREIYGIERPRITDFGVAKLAAGEIATTGQMLGTPAFMPPEQFTGAPIDGRTDLFSLGVILYWMATGEQPFPGETMTTVSYKIVHTEPVPPARLNPVIPAQFDKVILKCLAKSPADRYQTGEELALALAEVRRGAAPSGMKTTIPQATFAVGDTEATLDATSGFKPNGAAKHIPTAVLVPAESVKLPPQSAPQPASKRNGMIAGVVVLGAVAAAGGWFAVHHGTPSPAAQPVQQPVTTAPAPSAAPASPPAPAPEPTTSNTQSSAPAPAISKPSASTPMPAPLASAPTPVTQSHLAPVAFNPRTLDPKQNARLKIDLNHFLPAMDVTIEMNGKLYYKGTAGNKAGYDNLYVPPGEHEFRVTVSSANFQKASSSMSVKFAAKKHYTLKADLQPQPSSSPGAIINPATKVVATLKLDLFQF